MLFIIKRANIYKVLLYILLFNVTVAWSQNHSVKKWDYRFGGTDNDELTVFHQTADGGYVLGGFSHSNAGGDKSDNRWGTSNDYWIIKVDANGIKEWDKTYGGTGEDFLYSLQQTSDGGYILGGYSNSGISGNKTQDTRGSADYWIVKIGADGTFEWDADFGGSSNDQLSSVWQTNDGGYMLAGHSFSGISGDKTEANKGNWDYWLVKADSLGGYEWDKDFGGTAEDKLTSLQQTTDGGYIFGGYSLSTSGGDKTEPSQGGYDYWIIKTDFHGVREWDRTLGGSDDDRMYSLTQTSDGGYFLGGNSKSQVSGTKSDTLRGGTGDMDFWVVKLTSSGTYQWDKSYGGIKAEDEFGNIAQTSDDGYLIAGTSYSPISGEKSEDNILGPEQMWIVKTDSSGAKQWDKTIFTKGHDEIGYGLENSEGCYVFANYLTAGIGGYKTQTGQGVLDYWIIKFCDTSNVSTI